MRVKKGELEVKLNKFLKRVRMELGAAQGLIMSESTTFARTSSLIKLLSAMQTLKAVPNQVSEGQQM